MTVLVIAFFLLLLVPRAVPAGDPGTAETPGQKKMLQTELELAKKGSVYTLLDLSSQQAMLKIKGVVLKQFHLRDVSAKNEKTLSGSAHRLIKKYPAPPTIQKEIPPSDTAKKEISPLLASEPVFVSVGDMPARYQLYFEGGLTISVIPALEECACGEIEKGVRLIKERASTLFWEAERWVADGRLPDIRLSLSEEEAKALFWSLSEGSSVLIEPTPSQ